ncbi:MAG: protein kinase family protein [Legionella sp.]|nr:MAG: protein kinase family protein [Legionella sp.]
MNPYSTQYTVINPSDPGLDKTLPQIIEGTGYVPSFYPLSQGTSEYLFTYPLVEFEDQGHCFAVCDTECLGSGSFGFVYPVIGVWRQKNEGWTFEAAVPNHRQVIKTNINLNTNGMMDSNKILSSYKAEYATGPYVPHMGYKIPPFTYSDGESQNPASFLIMNRQEGQSLKALLTKAKTGEVALDSTKRIKIAVNLIKALLQLHQPLKDNKYLVHRDIKPENIIIDDEFNVRFIDFGLSELNDKCTTSKKGTALYIDPYIYSSSKARIQDKHSDYASLGRVIAELWGDESRDLVKDAEELHVFNKDNKFINLMAGITDLTPVEAQIITQNIIQLTEYHPDARVSMENALAVFNQLLEQRTLIEAQELSNLAATPLNQLTNDQLIRLVQGPYAQYIISRFIQEPQMYPHLMAALQAKLFSIGPNLLQQLKQNNFDFSQLTLSTPCIEESGLSAEQTQCAIELGAKLEAGTLNAYLNTDKEPTLNWAKTCRVLYQATTNADSEVIFGTNNRVASLFYNHFIKHPETAKDDLVNIKIVQQHLKVLEETSKIEENILNLIREIGDDSPLGMAIKSACINPSADLILVVPPDLLTIRDKLKQFNLACANILSLHTNCSPGFAEAKQKIQAKLHTRTLLTNMDWTTAMDIVPLALDYEHLVNIERLIGQLTRLFSKQDYPLLHEELEALYTTTSRDQLDDIETHVNLLSKAAHFISRIMLDQRTLAQLGCELLMSHPVMEAVQNFLREGVQLEQAQTVYDSLQQFHLQLNGLVQLFQQLKQAQKNSTSPKRKNLFEKLQRNTYTALNTMDGQALTQYFEQTKEFFTQEQGFVADLRDKPQVSEFLYELIHDKTTQAVEGSYGQCSALFKRIKTHALCDEFLINTIKQFQKLARSSESQVLSIHRQFKDSIWDYLNNEFTDREQHKQQFKHEIANLMQRLRDEIDLHQAQNPNNMFETNTKRRKTLNPSGLSVHRSNL